MSLEESVALIRAARFPEAEGRLRGLIESQPRRADALELLGVAISAQGREAEALPWFTRALEASPGTASVLHNRARALQGLGRLGDARADLEAALAAKPAMLPAWTLLGSVLATMGDAAGAERSYRRALTLRPDLAETHYNFAVFLQLAGRRDEAIAAYRAALVRNPAFVQALNNLGNALQSVGRLDEAFAQYAAAVKHDPNFAEAHSNWGAALRESGRVEEAIPLLERAVELKPDSPGVLNNLGAARFARHRYAEAIDSYRRALELRPAFHEARNNLGNALAALGNGEEAQECYLAVIAQEPRYAEAWNNLGLLQQDRGELDAALASYERALALDPARADAVNNMGLLLEERGRRDEAMALYARALQINPGLARAAYNLAITHLHRREFARGWELAESRFETVPPVTPRRSLDMPRFTAADWGRGHRVAIWREQGVGDQLLFATLLPSLEARGQDFVVEVDRRLIAAFARAHPRWRVVALEDSAEAFVGCDRELALGSLPGLLRPTIESFADQPRALLAADEARAAAYRRELGERARWVGISWRSFQPKQRAKVARGKSAPLGVFADLARTPGIGLVDLQYGDTATEREQFAASSGRLRRLEGLDLFGDVDGVMAAIEACDLVVTTSNVTAHFAGALGKRTLLFYLNAVAPFHYWVPGPDGRCLWYPSVEIVTGAGIDTWDKALARIDEILAI